MRARELLALNKSALASAQSGSLPSLRRQLAQGATPDFKDERNQQLTALHHAARWGHVGIAQCLIDAGWGLEARTHDGHTPLSMATFNARLAVCETLVRAGADMNVRVGTRQTTPLHICAQKRASGREVGVWLVQQGADCDGVDIDGNTPLHETAVWGDLELARALIQAGANVEVANRRGQTMQDVARAFQHTEFVSLVCGLKAMAEMDRIQKTTDTIRVISKTMPLP
jgi:ankyrin repeat protein